VFGVCDFDGDELEGWVGDPVEKEGLKQLPGRLFLSS
jgi:hypothetical protein